MSWTPNLPENLLLPARWTLPLDNVEDIVSLSEDGAVVNLSASYVFNDCLTIGRSLFTTIRSDLQFDARCELYYYEVKITDLSPLNHILGMGIHAHFMDNPHGSSCTYMSNGTMTYRGFGLVPRVWSYGAAYGSGDVIGCGFRKSDQSIFFARNGAMLGSAIPPEAHGQYLPTTVRFSGPPSFYPELRFASRPSSVSVRANFGREPFLFDINKYCELVGTRFAKFKTDATVLPPEVLHQILVHAVHITPLGESNSIDSKQTSCSQESRTALSRLSMVCRHWSKRARPQLYHCTILSKPDHIPRFTNFVLKSPSGMFPGLFVNLLAVIGVASPQLGLVLLSSLPRQLKRLTTVVWDAKDFPTTGSLSLADCTQHRFPPRFLVAMPSLFQVFASLKSLTLRGLHFGSHHRFARLICSLPNLETLTACDVLWPECAADFPLSRLYRSSRLRKVDVTMSDTHLLGDCMAKIGWLFVGRLKPSASRSVSRTYRDRPLLPGLVEADSATVTLIIKLFVSELCGQFGSELSSTDPPTMVMELETDQRAGWELSVRSSADNENILTLHFSRISAEHASVQMDKVTVSLDFSTFISETKFHEFCTELDSLVASLSNFPRLQCELRNSSPTPTAKNRLSWAPIYMPNLSNGVLSIHGCDEPGTTDGEEVGTTNSVATLPSFTGWLADYDEQLSWGRDILNVNPTKSNVSSRGLLENDVTRVGYSY